jgi:hypothetical protein
MCFYACGKYYVSMGNILQMWKFFGPEHGNFFPNAGIFDNHVKIHHHPSKRSSLVHIYHRHANHYVSMGNILQL